LDDLAFFVWLRENVGSSKAFYEFEKSLDAFWIGLFVLFCLNRQMIIRAHDMVHGEGGREITVEVPPAAD
jgi:hypothetical protein